MKFKVGDNVIVTGGKDKGKKGQVIRVVKEKNTVVVEGVNLYVKHIKPMNGREGQRVQRPRPLPTANVAIMNNKSQADRVGYKINKDGTKVRVYKKTGEVIPEVKPKTKKK
jgi:large subunit ribosomal protein L24